MVPLVCRTMGVEMCECSAVACVACHGSQTRGWPAPPCQGSNGTRVGLGMPKPAETGLFWIQPMRRRQETGIPHCCCVLQRTSLASAFCNRNHTGSAEGPADCTLNQPLRGSGREEGHRRSLENEIEVHYLSQLMCLWLWLWYRAVVSSLFSVSPLKDNNNQCFVHGKIWTILTLLSQDIHQKCFASMLTISNIER